MGEHETPFKVSEILDSEIHYVHTFYNLWGTFRTKYSFYVRSGKIWHRNQNNQTQPRHSLFDVCLYLLIYMATKKAVRNVKYILEHYYKVSSQ